jgi:hypothetical protein
MLIGAHLSGTVTRSSHPLKEGLNLVGSVRGRVNPLTLTVETEHPLSPPGIAEAEIPLLYGDAIALMVEGGRLRYIAPDTSGHRDVFYTFSGEDGCLLGDDFFELLQSFEELSVDRKAVEYFVTHGYFPPGDTYFKEIKRVRTGNRLIFGDDASPREGSLFGLLRRNRSGQAPEGPFEQFKKSFRSILESESTPGDDAVLLSGGCDSGLIAAVGTRQCRRKLETFTMQHALPLAGNSSDVQVAKALSDFLGLEHTVITVDFDTVKAGLLEDFVTAMPLAAHLSVHLHLLVSFIADRGFKRFWSGQNADSIYNLGPTKPLRLGDGKEDLIKRFFMSREYISSLSDIRPRIPLSALVRLAGVVGSGLLARRYRREFVQPDNFNELFHEYRLSENYLVLKTAGSSARPPLVDPLTSSEARERLFDEKLSAFLVGRDARVVWGAADLCALRAVMPFSAPNLLLFFREMEMTWRDVVWPKRYIYRYFREILGEGNYKRIYRSPARGGEGGALRRPEWEKKMIHETRFGRQLVAELLPLESWCDLEIDIDTGRLQYLLSLYWYRKVRRKAEEAGVELC